MRRKTTSVTTPESEQVEQLLQAAHDELLLNLSVDSHMSRVAPDYLQSDLDRRFQALRSRPPRQSPAKQKERPRRPVIDPDDVDQQLRNVLGDDLSARFAALKASSSSSSSANGYINMDEAVTGSNGYGATQEDGDEVDKLIRWATDAARLDPSPLSEEEDEGHDEEDDGDDDDSEDDDLRKSKRKMASKKSSRKD